MGEVIQSTQQLIFPRQTYSTSPFGSVQSRSDPSSVRVCPVRSRSEPTLDRSVPQSAYTSLFGLRSTMVRSGPRPMNSLKLWMALISQSSRREEDDEEALKWVAIERLPAYDRLRKGILTTSDGDAN